MFDASTSSSPNGPITSYAWNFGDGLTGVGVTTDHYYEIAGTYTVTLMIWDWGDGSAFDFGVTASHTYLSPGTYTITLYVTDSSGYSASGIQIITVH